MKLRAWSHEFKRMYYSEIGNSPHCYMKREYAPFVFELGWSSYDESKLEYMWCTEKQDINNIDCYEGDVIKFDLFNKKYETGTIIFIECEFRVQCKDGRYRLSQIDKFEIVGNKFESSK